MNELKLSHFYKTYMTTDLLELDIKSIRKINNIYLKYVRTNKNSYLFEIYNILYILNNKMDLQAAKLYVLFYIEDEIKDKIQFILEKVNEKVF